MIRFLLSLLIALCSIVTVSAQGSRISFSTYMGDAAKGLSEDNCKLLENKMSQIISRNGAGTVGASSVIFSIRPVLTASPAEVVNTGVRPVTVRRGELTLYAENRADKSVFCSTIVRLEGTGANDDLALRQMIARINVTDVRFAQFIRNAQTKVEEFFAQATPQIVQKADMLAKQGHYDEAVVLLSMIPETVAEYATVTEKLNEYYTKQVDMEATRKMDEASVLLVKGEVDAALDILVNIDPMSTKYDQAKKMIANVRSGIESERAAESARKAEEYEMRMEQQQREMDAQMAMERMKLEAANRYSEQTVSNNTLEGGTGEFLLGCAKDIIVGLVTK